ncbi:hypothetical protein B9Z19DRAFT_1062252 [Tuber borchii]|uniref:Uncharacterized protein n=1 Tax=Tuber borchii TaxID=42251 RepID=A0A2T7A2E1_TUBBO|nr:hypothetical protein B9Z19DRAFT_1062252 [Tuber borchii]
MPSPLSSPLPSRASSTSSILSSPSSQLLSELTEIDPPANFPLPIPAQCARKVRNKAISELLNLADGTPGPQSIVPPPRNLNQVLGWYTHLTLVQLLDPFLTQESVQNSCWLGTPIVTTSRLMQLWTYLNEITSSLDLQVSRMMMEDFTTTLSAV